MKRKKSDKSEPVKALFTRMPESVHRELKVRCAMDGVPLSGVVLKLVRAYLSGKVKLRPED